MRVGEPVEVDISRLSLEGEGLGELDQREIRVHGAFPGERVRARIEHLSKQHPRAEAKKLEVLTPHPDRHASPCPDDVTNGGRCTGCALGVLGVEAQRAMKTEMLRSRFGLETELAEGGEAYGYRASSKRIAFRHGPRVGLGSYVRDSHKAASMRHCRVDHPRIASVARQIEDLATELRIEPYDERNKTGALRAVWLRTNGETVLVTLVVTRDEPALFALAARLEGVVGVVRALAKAEGNDLRGASLAILRGSDRLEVTLGGEATTVGPLAFLQPNPVIAAAAYRELVATDDPGSTLALDLYAGAGVTTTMLRRRYAEVVPVESFPDAARALGIAPSSVVDALARRIADGAERPSFVVANPPRAGLGEAVCRSLATIGPDRIAIMSCHPGSLERDLALLEASGYRRVRTRWFDTLPNTPHVEVVVHLARER